MPFPLIGVFCLILTPGGGVGGRSGQFLPKRRLSRDSLRTFERPSTSCILTCPTDTQEAAQRGSKVIRDWRVKQEQGLRELGMSNLMRRRTRRDRIGVFQYLRGCPKEGGGQAILQST